MKFWQINEFIPHKRLALFLVICGIAFRCLFVIIHPYPDAKDAYQYDLIAQNILNGRGISEDSQPPYNPQIDRVPFYPIFMAFFYLLFGHHLVVIRIVQALMSVFTAFFVYLLTQKITKKNAYFKNIPLISFGLTLLCPFLILFVSILFSETLFSFLIVLSVLFFIYAMDGPTKYYFYSGIFIGLAFMTRPVIFAFPICMGFAFFFANHSNPKKFLIRIGVYLLPFFTIWGIWIARNYIAFDRFIPMTAQDGVFLLVGTYPPNRYENDLPTEAKKETGTFVFIPESERIEVVKNMRKKAFQRILDYPFQYVLYCIQRIPILWFSSYSHYISINEEFGCLLKNFTKNWYNNIKNMQLLTIKFFLLLINIFYLITGAIGMLLLSKKWSTVFPLYILIFYFTLIHLPLGFANARYVIPIYPFFLIFCSFGMFYIFQKFKREKIGIF